MRNLDSRAGMGKILYLSKFLETLLFLNPSFFAILSRVQEIMKFYSVNLRIAQFPVISITEFQELTAMENGYQRTQIVTILTKVRHLRSALASIDTFVN